jgi:hypothetical protein
VIAVQKSFLGGWIPTVIHSGETGVERGADRAARALGIPISGYCRHNARDELGPLPAPIAADLTACQTRGSRSPVSANLELASAAIIVVPRAAMAAAVTGVDVVLRLARAMKVPYQVVDDQTDLSALAAWVRALPREEDKLQLMITGPRGTRWQEGERLGWRAVASLVMT